MNQKPYTRHGDAGYTSSAERARVPKDHPLIEAYGALDELNAWVGFLRDRVDDEGTRNQLKRIQELIFSIGGSRSQEPAPRDVTAIERQIDSLNTSLGPPAGFVLPGGHPLVSLCHVVRSTCRRAERVLVAAHEDSAVTIDATTALGYLNRLSDYFFLLARSIAARLDVEELTWRPEADR
jgi:cob(I)alamin adenosyltransferase